MGKEKNEQEDIEQDQNEDQGTEPAEDDATGAEESGEGGDEEAGADDAEAKGDEEDADAGDGERAPDKPIPVKSWLAQKKKFSERVRAAEARAQEYETKLKAAAASEGLDPAQYKAYKAYIGKLQSAAKGDAILQHMLAAIENDLTPDYRTLAPAVEARVKALPNADPAMQAELRRMQEVTARLEHQSNVAGFKERRQEEQAEIKALFKEAADDHFMATLDSITTALVKALPEEAFKTAVPNRVEIAKMLMTYGEKRVKGLLKNQKVVERDKPRAESPSLKGGKNGGSAPKGINLNKALTDDAELGRLVSAVEQYEKAG